MNKWEAEVQKSLLSSEEAAIKELEKQYKKALNDINEKVKLFDSDIKLLQEAINADGLDESAKAVLQSQQRSKIYQKQFQEALQGQVSGILDNLQGAEYATIEKYLKDCYTDGYVGTMYDIAHQGIPVIMPIDQAAVVKAVLTDSKVSKGLYNALGVNVKKLKKTITQEVSRGIATGLSFNDIARNISNAAKAPLSRAKTIARTEGHRIQVTSTADAQKAAKAKGADAVKQWDATLDGKTRDSHRRVDGEIRELDEKFSNGLRQPGDSAGGAAEVVNCRCALLTRARLALDEDELKTLEDRAEFFGLDKTKNFDDFKEKYLKAVESAEVKTDAVNDKLLDNLKKSLQEMTPQESKAAWNNVLSVDENTATELNALHSELNKHMIHHQTEQVSLFSLIESKSMLDEAGDIDSVTLSKEAIKLLKDSPENSIIFSHVHPNNGSFSLEDIQKLVSYKSVKALTVELPNGEKYAIERGSFKSGFLADSKFYSAYTAAEKEAREKFSELYSIPEEDMTVELYEKQRPIWNECVDYRNKLIAEKLGMKYIKVSNNE